jgi:hypothetical protein
VLATLVGSVKSRLMPSQERELQGKLINLKATYSGP